MPTTDETTVGTMVIRYAEGILYLSFTPQATHDLDNAKQVLTKLDELLGDKKVPVFIDGTNIQSMESNARTYYASTEGVRHTRALAIIANTLMSKVIGNLYVGLNRPSYPTQIFTDREAALKWLQQYK